MYVANVSTKRFASSGGAADALGTTLTAADATAADADGGGGAGRDAADEVVDVELGELHAMPTNATTASDLKSPIGAASREATGPSNKCTHPDVKPENDVPVADRDE